VGLTDPAGVPGGGALGAPTISANGPGIRALEGLAVPRGPLNQVAGGAPVFSRAFSSVCANRILAQLVRNRCGPVLSGGQRFIGAARSYGRGRDPAALSALRYASCASFQLLAPWASWSAGFLGLQLQPCRTGRRTSLARQNKLRLAPVPCSTPLLQSPLAQAIGCSKAPQGQVARRLSIAERTLGAQGHDEPGHL